MGKRLSHGKQQKTGSGILLQVSILILVVFILSGIVSLMLNLRSTNELTEKNKEKIIKALVQDMSTSFTYIADDLQEEVIASPNVGVVSIPEFVDAIVNKDVMPVQVEANSKMKEIVDEGVLETELLAFVIPEAPPVIEEPVLFMSSEEKLMYSEVPDEILEILDSGDEHGIIEDGISEWDLRDEQLVVFEEFSIGESAGIGWSGYATALRPIHDDIEEINENLNKEKEDLNILMLIVVACFSVALFIIIFVVLSYLIRSRITRPIEELSEAAEQVIEGDFNVEVSVREGEEFANLKNVFNLMLKSMREFIMRSVSEKND